MSWLQHLLPKASDFLNSYAVYESGFIDPLYTEVRGDVPSERGNTFIALENKPGNDSWFLHPHPLLVEEPGPLPSPATHNTPRPPRIDDPEFVEGKPVMIEPQNLVFGEHGGINPSL